MINGNQITGLFELHDNYGFIRSNKYSYAKNKDDIYVNHQLVSKYNLKNGDLITGIQKDNKLKEINEINYLDPNSGKIKSRKNFKNLTALFPDEKFNLSNDNDPSLRIIDLFSPIGKGQRGLIVAPPKTGKTMLLQKIANSIVKNNPETHLIILLIDERPEEVTDMKRNVNAEVIASTFDEPATNHVRVAELVINKAKRLVECGNDVCILLDSITRLARAYNTVTPSSGKTLSGGIDPNAIQKPKKFFGSARKIEDGGSLSIIATALIETGSRMDEVIFEEFKGTGNMELQLDRNLSNKRLYPAIDIVNSSTRRDDLLLDTKTLQRSWLLRKYMSDMTSIESLNFILDNIKKTKNNNDFLDSMN